MSATHRSSRLSFRNTHRHPHVFHLRQCSGLRIEGSAAVGKASHREQVRAEPDVQPHRVTLRGRSGGRARMTSWFFMATTSCSSAGRSTRRAPILAAKSDVVAELISAGFGVFRWRSQDPEAQSLTGEPFGRRAAQAESRSRVGHPGTTVRRNPALCPMPAIAARSTTRPVAPNTRRSLGRSPVRGASQDATSHRARGSRPDSRWGLSLERFQRGGSSCRLVPSGRLCRASRPFGPSRGVPRLCFPGSPERSPRECGAASEELRRPFVEREPTRSGLAPETPT